MMNACGLVVEYNPFHNGHLYHIQEAKRISGADVMIAVMSGNFLQRGEPAIIDKFHRARAALAGGADIILELPFCYAVQSSEWFAKGAVASLAEAGVSSICFGSESGDVDAFLKVYNTREQNTNLYQEVFRSNLDNGLSFPEANRAAYRAIGLDNGKVDLSQPNNILGFSYVKEIIEKYPTINPLTIKRTSNHYHDQEVRGKIASATSIRKHLLEDRKIANVANQAITKATEHSLKSYAEKSGLWHAWEQYFPYLQYKVLVSPAEELALYHGVEEGLENRIKKFATAAGTMNEWLSLVKTKRYTWTRLQRTFVHILLNIKKEEIKALHDLESVSYLRVLGMNQTGRKYLNHVKKTLNVPLITRIYQEENQALLLEERAAQGYYSVLTPERRLALFQQEMCGPIIVE